MGNTQSKVSQYEAEIPHQGFLENYVTKDRSRREVKKYGLHSYRGHGLLKELDFRVKLREMEADENYYWSFI